MTELWTIHNGDALESLRQMPDNSVDAIITDPPYFRVKSEAWDRQWGDAAAFIAWMGELCAEWSRILRPNGSLWVFASPQMAARVEVKIGETFNVLNRISWFKREGWHKGACKEDLRSFFPATEAIIFAEHRGADNIAKGEAGYGAKCDELRGFVFEPLRAYLAGEWERAGLTKGDAEVATGTQMAGHWFSRSQWALPTAKHYATLQARANNGGGDCMRREYEDLRREYEDLRRPFSVTAEVPYTDVWGFPTVQTYAGKHPCEKPLALMDHIVTSSTRPGAVVLDCFMGSGSTGVACVRNGREFIGVEIDPKWCAIARTRMALAEAPTMFEVAG